VRLSQGVAWTFGGSRIGTDATLSANGELHSLVSLRGSVGYQAERLNPRLTRGGPMAQDPAGYAAGFNLNTDVRGKRTYRLGMDMSGDASGAWQRRANVNLAYKSSGSWDLSLGPSLTRSFGTAQYVATVTDPTAASTFGRRYVFADIDQTTLSMDVRFNVTFNPETSLELFAQPFLSSGDYESLKELAAPRTFSFRRYGTDAGGSAAVEDGRRFEIDPDGVGPARSFRVDNKDFNVRSLRANAVFRWEWRPGSTLFLVWQQMRTGNLEAFDPNDAAPRLGRFDFGRNAGDLLQLRGDNILLVKASYWFNP
jgi:hypothetical protein